MLIVITNTYTLNLNVNTEVDVTFNIQADMFYEAGKLYGAPEDCYPADSDCDITEIDVVGTVEGFTPAELVAALKNQYADEIEEDLWSEYNNDEDYDDSDDR